MTSINRVFITIICFILAIPTFAQEDLVHHADSSSNIIENRLASLENALKKFDNFTISGYFQMYYLHGEKDAQLRLGSPNENPDKSFSRIGIRRSRLKFTYEEGIGSAVFQIDFSDRGIVIRDAYLKFKDPWLKSSFFQTGIFFRPFGHDVRYSSSRRETPERARITTTLFPAERDLGAMLQFKTPESSPLHIFTLETALIAGNGVAQETDSRRDFIGHLGASPNLGDKARLAFGVSYYYGSVFQGTENVLTMHDGGFVLNSDPSNLGRYAKREYIGFDLQTTLQNPFGRSHLRSEYIWGQQPGLENSSMSPNTSTRRSGDTYIRNLSGGYIIFVQDIGRLPFSAVARYDWYDPNTKISGNNIGLNGTNETDLLYTTIGLGIQWKPIRNLIVQTYYEFIRNETSSNLVDFTKDQQDNIFALTLQYVY